MTLIRSRGPLLLSVLFLFLVLILPATPSTDRPPIRLQGPLSSRTRFPRRPDESSQLKPIVIRIRNPSAIRINAGRRVDVPPGVRESAVLRLKPVIRFHKLGDEESATSPTSAVPDLYEFVGNQMGLKKTAALLRKADLGPRLLSLGELTLFAPTDEAFSLTPRGFLENLQAQSNEEELLRFLLRHVTKGRITPDVIRNDITLPSLDNGAPLRFNVYARGQMLTVSGSQLLDGFRTLGSVVVQPVDRLLDPPERDRDLLRVMQKEYPALHSFFHKSGLGLQLSSGTFTVLAPSNEAFTSLPKKAQELLLSNSTLLRRVLLNHVIPGTYFSAALTDGFALRSMGGEIHSFTSRRGLILVNGIPMVRPDIPAVNGVLHGLNRLLMPADVAEVCQCMPRYGEGVHRQDVTVVPDQPTESKKFGYSEETNELNGVTTTTSQPTSYLVTDSFGQSKHSQPNIVQSMMTPMTLPDGRQVTFSISNNLFRKALLLNRLRRPSPKGFTVLLPSDDAFGRLGSEALQRLEQNPRLLRQVLMYHMAEGRVPNRVFAQSGRIVTLGGPLVISVQNGEKTVLVGGARILASRPASNGIVYAVDRVSYPLPEPTLARRFLGSPVSFKLNEPESEIPDDPLSIWRAIVDSLPEAKEALRSNENVYTMFAPTNAAFAALPRASLLRLLKEEPLRRELFWNHMVPGAVYPASLLPGTIISTVSGSKLRFESMPGGFLANGVPVTHPGAVAGNGVAFLVNKLLFQQATPRISDDEVSPEKKDHAKDEKEWNLENIATSRNARQFLRWIRDTGMQNRIRQLGRCTVFMPTDSAIASMSPALRGYVLGSPAKLARLVRFHISPVPLSPETLNSTDDLVLPTLRPKAPVRCNRYAGGRVLTVSGSPVVEITPTRDLTVVVVNRTLTAPVGDLMLTASKSPLLRNFSKILRVADMESELSNGGPLTLFAPSQCALDRLPPEEYQRLVSDPRVARDFVRRHLVRGCYYAGGLLDGKELISEAGITLHIRTPPDCITVNGVKIKYGDLSTTNGVLHILGNVL